MSLIQESPLASGWYSVTCIVMYYLLWLGNNILEFVVSCDSHKRGYLPAVIISWKCCKQVE